MRYTHPRYKKCLFTNIQKQWNVLQTYRNNEMCYKHTETMKCVKNSLLFEKNINFTVELLENYLHYECEIFRVLFLYEPEHILKFSNLHYCTFKRRFHSKSNGKYFLIRKFIVNLVKKSKYISNWNMLRSKSRTVFTSLLKKM